MRSRLVNPSRFNEWLSVYFEPYDGVASVWEAFPPGSPSPQFSASADEIADLFIYTLERSGDELAGLSDWQVGNGLDNLLNSHFTDVAYVVRNGAVSDAKRLACVHALKTLYADCLTPRASPSLGHLSETSECPPLNMICYMLWDVTPLSHWGEGPRADAMYPALADVMESALQSDNPAVIESGLHGLGHMVYSRPDLAVPPIDRLIAHRRSSLRHELHAYAKKARTGMIL